MGNPYKMEQECQLENTEVRLIHGVMGAGKTAHLIDLVEQLEQRKELFAIIKPALDTRDTGIHSRDGRERKCQTISTEAELITLMSHNEGLDWLLVDEAQFFKPEFIDLICNLANNHHVSHVYFYSLRTDYMGVPFTAWKEITRYADRWFEIPMMCEECKKQRAVWNMRLSGGTELFEVGTDNYRSVCDRCHDKHMKEEKKC